MCHTFLTVMEAETVPALKKKVAAGQPPKCTLPKRVYVSVRFKVYSKFAQMLESHTVGGTGKSHLQDWVWTSDVGLREKIYDAEYQSKGLTRLEATIKGTCLSEQGAKTLLEHFRGFVSGGLTFNSIRNQWTGFCKKLKSSCFIVDLPRERVTHVRWINEDTNYFNSHTITTGREKTSTFLRDIQHFAFNLPIFVYVVTYDVIATAVSENDKEPSGEDEEEAADVEDIPVPVAKPKNIVIKDGLSFRLCAPSISHWLDIARTNHGPFVKPGNVEYEASAPSLDQGAPEEDDSDAENEDVANGDDVPLPCKTHAKGERVTYPFDALSFMIDGDYSADELGGIFRVRTGAKGFIGKWINRLSHEKGVDFSPKFVNAKVVPSLTPGQIRSATARWLRSLAPVSRTER